MIVQRALAAKDIGHARGATLMAGYLKFLPLFIIIMPGMISRVLFTGRLYDSVTFVSVSITNN